MTPDAHLRHIAAVGQTDQLTEGLVRAAATIWAYYTALVNQGFTPQQALDIAIAWQTAALRGQQQPEGGAA